MWVFRCFGFDAVSDTSKQNRSSKSCFSRQIKSRDVKYLLILSDISLLAHKLVASTRSGQKAKRQSLNGRPDSLLLWRGARRVNDPLI